MTVEYTVIEKDVYKRQIDHFGVRFTGHDTVPHRVQQVGFA